MPAVYARATNIRRTQQSAQNLLLGLYPEEEAGSVPIEVRATDEETLYPNADRRCRRQVGGWGVVDGWVDGGWDEVAAAVQCCRGR